MKEEKNNKVMIVMMTMIMVMMSLGQCCEHCNEDALIVVISENLNVIGFVAEANAFTGCSWYGGGAGRGPLQKCLYMSFFGSDKILVPADAFDNIHEANLSIIVPKNYEVSLTVLSGYIL
uniref:Uncharacterized protein n=1 Tax=Oryza punctata TaxID=4537 RepID=A0A0E0M5D5_ORYPU